MRPEYNTHRDRLEGQRAAEHKSAVSNEKGVLLLTHLNAVLSWLEDDVREPSFVCESEPMKMRSSNNTQNCTITAVTQRQVVGESISSSNLKVHTGSATRRYLGHYFTVYHIHCTDHCLIHYPGNYSISS